MKFGFPVKKINDTCWFLSNEDALKYGQVKLITLAISEVECNIYYRILLENDEHVTVKEDQILEDRIVVPTPKFRLGDEVDYSFTTTDNIANEGYGIVEKVEIHNSSNNRFSIVYFLEGDEETYFNEFEIQGFHEKTITMQDEGYLT